MSIRVVPRILYCLLGTAVLTVATARICHSGTPYWREYNHNADAISGQVDCDNDGYDDVVIGAPNASGGQVYVYTSKTGTLLHSLQPASGVGFGVDVASLGDVNGDGNDDFVATASQWGWLSTGHYAGKQWVFSGADGSIIFEHAGSWCPYEAAWRVSGGADIDDDGLPDYVVNHGSCYSTDPGRIVVLNMPAGDTLYDIQPPQQFAYVSMLGDVTGDGRDDFAAGFGNYAYLYSGATGTSVHTFQTGTSNPSLGDDPIRDAGDVDGDGVHDILAHGPDMHYKATLYKGGSYTPLFSFIDADSTNTTFGMGVAGLGDISGDGKSDVAISGISGTGAGGDFSWFKVYSGADGSVLAADTIKQSGGAVVKIAPAGDANADGYGDLLVLYYYPGYKAVRIYTFSPDTDGDGVMDVHDNCPSIANADQADNDLDGWGTFCDCNDADPNINPGTDWFEDTDGDGYGNASSTLTQCLQPVGFVLDGSDCDDADASINPATYWYADFDGDGFGNPAVASQQCTSPAEGWVLNGDDCDDANASISMYTWYADADGDGYGNVVAALAQCDQPEGYVADATDCDDADALINPATVWYEDADADGWGDASSSLVQCPQPDGYVLNSDDNCPTDYNPLLEDQDHDGIGDVCDPYCCAGTPTGNVDCDPGDLVDIGDLTRLIDYLFISFNALCCEGEANTDGTGVVDIGDLTTLIGYLFIPPYPEPASCP